MSDEEASRRREPAARSGGKRTLRGGTWDRSTNVLRSGYRKSSIVDGYGFRVVRTPNVP